MGVWIEAPNQFLKLPFSQLTFFLTLGEGRPTGLSLPICTEGRFKGRKEWESKRKNAFLTRWANQWVALRRGNATFLVTIFLFPLLPTFPSILPIILTTTIVAGWNTTGDELMAKGKKGKRRQKGARREGTGGRPRTWKKERSEDTWFSSEQPPTRQTHTLRFVRIYPA